MTVSVSGRRQVVLVRHADAGDRVADRRVDALRPLSQKGEWQAQKIAETLASYVPGRILSSRATRCYSTVAPLAEQSNIPVEEVDELFEGSDPSVSWRLLVAAVSGVDRVIVACSHGDVIPGIVEMLDHEGVMHDEIPKISKGAAVIVTLVGERAEHLQFLPAPRTGQMQ